MNEDIAEAIAMAILAPPMTTIITEATLDAAAEVLRGERYKGFTKTPCQWRDLPKSRRRKWIDLARVALQAVQDVLAAPSEGGRGTADTVRAALKSALAAGEPRP